MCASFYVFRPVRSGERSRFFSGRVKFSDDERWSYVSLKVTDKRVAEQKLAEFVKERELESVGLLAPRGARTAFTTPLSDHITAFLAEKQGRGRAPRTIKKYRYLLGVLCRQCGWHTLRDVTAASFVSWRQQSKNAPKYLNDLHGVLTGFLRWMERHELLTSNPLRHVEKVSNAARPAYRRALSVDEVRRLLASAPPSRAWVYLVMVYTGLRRNEMNQLTWGDFHFDRVPPVAVLSASITKNRKSSVVRLRREVVEALQANRPDLSIESEWVFRGKVPSPAKLRRDLEAVGIPFLDERGQRVDIHALRHTFGTMLSAAGVSPRVAMEAMRHSDIRLTMRIYTDAAQLPVASELDKLPSFSVPIADAHSNAQTGVSNGLRRFQPVAQGVSLDNVQVPSTVILSRPDSSPVATGDELKMVGLVRFELTTSCTPCKRATRLRYSPNKER